jgi:hypothetical protein
MNKNPPKIVHDLLNLMVSKVFKFECIYKLFRGLEVIEKRKRKKGANPLRPMRPKASKGL